LGDLGSGVDGFLPIIPDAIVICNEISMYFLIVMGVILSPQNGQHLPFHMSLLSSGGTEGTEVARSLMIDQGLFEVFGSLLPGHQQ